MIRTLSLIGVIALAATGARAEISPAPSPLSFLVRPGPARSAPAIPLRYAQAPAELPRGVARTSVERREGGVTGAAGVLCGLQPNADDSGFGSARGYEREGRFVGAKLAFSF